MEERNSNLMNMTIHFALPQAAANLPRVVPAGVARPIEMIRFRAVQGEAGLIARLAAEACRWRSPAYSTFAWNGGAGSPSLL
jgi:hypothetical protein